MRQIEIQRTPTAYTLRFSPASRKSSALLSGGVFLMGATASAAPWLIYGAKPPAGMILVSIYTALCGVIIPLILLRSTLGFRLVADEVGVHRYVFGRVKRSFLWRHIRSCGLDEIPPSQNEGRVIAPSFYVSTESPVEAMKNCLFIRLQNKEDQHAIHESGLLTFCRSQMADADRKFR